MSTPESTAEPTPEAAPEATAEATAEPTAEATAEPTPASTVEATAEAAPEATAEPTPAPMPEAMPEPSSEAIAEPSYEAMPEPSSEAMPEPSSEAMPEPSSEAMPDAWPEAIAEPSYEAMPDAWPEAMPDLQALPVEASALPAAGTAAADEVPAAGIEPGPAAPADDLRAAVGLPGQPARRGARPRGPGRRIALFIGVTALLGAVAASLVFLGRQNRQRYFVVCGEDDIAAAQGRSFPPWGRSALEGKAWQAIPRPLDAPCEDRVFDSREGLARSFGETLVARAEAWVTAREDGAGRERLAEVQAQLDQAQRVLRELRGPGAGQSELSGKLERLRGDLDYWQARDRIDTAMAELARAAQHLDSAVAHDPHHNRENALMWQRVVARLQAELGRAAPGSAPAPVPDPAAPGTAAGTALPAPETPLQPGTDSPSVPAVDSLDPAADPNSDAGPASAPPVPGAAVPASPPSDAGVARGGLLI
jgi:hypothetical protein